MEYLTEETRLRFADYKRAPHELFVDEPVERLAKSIVDGADLAVLSVRVQNDSKCCRSGERSRFLFDAFCGSQTAQSSSILATAGSSSVIETATSGNVLGRWVIVEECRSV
ncbi:uncharacterized protein RCC_06074 [Ramularia collo-cygni]|uniref:Uncharacterized protein n=1 Tax=Ramularia collo-cygni TaxID=112498 RepID=A0A2D3V681_9PEZI|nr:uncharacterized protein RCC_06074 [Ramularia collo-cygni]CZT20217.1 uncharacterized protein RCC_06074 [Ramularia collo-cygni]